MHRAEGLRPFPLKRRQIQVRRKCIHDPAKPNVDPAWNPDVNDQRACFGSNEGNLRELAVESRTNSASIFDLSASEKLQLVEDLWDDLAAAPEAVPVHDWQKHELARRKANLLEEPGVRAGLGRGEAQAAWALCPLSWWWLRKLSWTLQKPTSCTKNAERDWVRSS